MAGEPTLAQAAREKLDAAVAGYAQAKNTLEGYRLKLTADQDNLRLAEVTALVAIAHNTEWIGNTLETLLYDLRAGAYK